MLYTRSRNKATSPKNEHSAYGIIETIKFSSHVESIGVIALKYLNLLFYS